MKKPQTHREYYKLFLDSVNELTDAINKKNNELKEIKDYDETTQLHYTKKIINKWFYLNGHMPL